jgi:hypothetical protein
MRPTCQIAVLALLTGLCLLPWSAPAQEPATAPETQPVMALQLQDLSWLVGHWQGEAPGGGVVEEVWTAPAAGAMMGAFRWTGGDKVMVYEFLLVEETPEGLVLRLRHFGKGSVAWEDKETPLNFWAKSGGEGTATFEAQTEKGWLRLVLRREGEGLVVVLERESGGPLEFRYTQL